MTLALDLLEAPSIYRHKWSFQMPSKPLFSIATPSFRSSRWLKLCIASVADQQGVEHEHIVQDSCSDDGTQEWLPHDTRVKAFIEKDCGMYDGVNRGWKRATGEILSYLNCDEQYLPGSLAAVAEVFEKHPEIDFVFGDAVVVGGDGSYRFHRKMLPPQLHHTWVVHLETLTCAMFLRRRVLDEHGLSFDPNMRYSGDGVFVLNALKKGLKAVVIRRFISAFTDTGGNMMMRPSAVQEREELQAKAPKWVQALRPLWIGMHRARKLVGGIYSQQPFSYEIYTLDSPEKRIDFRVDHPTFRWKLGE